MKRWLPLILTVAVVGVLAPRVVMAQSNTAGIHLSWTDCGTFGAQDRAFACNSNSGTNILTCSFFVPGAFDTLTGAAGVIDLITDQSTLPSWWNLQAGGCRVGSPPNLSANFNFTAATNCTDPWGGVAAGGIACKVMDGVQITDPRRCRFDWVCAIYPGLVGPDSTLEYYAANVAFNNKATVGTGSCAGCNFPACIRFNSIQLSRPVHGQQNQDEFFFSTPIATGGSQQVTWQGGAGVDCSLVPARNKTWGQIKSLYR